MGEMCVPQSLDGSYENLTRICGTAGLKCEQIHVLMSSALTKKQGQAVLHQMFTFEV